MRLLSALALLVAGGLLPVFAGQERSAIINVLTLEDAVRLAIQNNPDLLAAGGRIEAASGRAQQLRQWSNPELELSAQDWPVGNGGGFSDAKQTIGVAQTLPFPGKKSLDRQIGGAGGRLSEAERAMRRLEVVRDVKAAFFQVLASERLVGVSGELVNVAESSAATARKRVDAGATAYQEQLRAEIQREQARAELTGYQRELAAARQSLALQLGQPDMSETPLSGTLAETANSELLEPNPERWLASHPVMVAARAKVDRAELEGRRARLEPYPDVKVGVAGGRIGETGESIVELGFTLPLPIIDRSKGRKLEARANVTIAEAELAALRQRLMAEWNKAGQRYRAAVEQAAGYRDRILPKAGEALRLVQKGFEEGKFSFIDLLDTQRTAAEAQLAFQKKLLELNLAQAELEALLHSPTTDPPATRRETNP